MLLLEVIKLLKASRFIFQDNLEFAVHNSVINLYAYYKHSPINLVDSYGQTFVEKCASMMAKVFGYGKTKFLWASLSKTMASTVAMDSVTLFYGGSISSTSIYMMYEYPALIKRGIEIIQKFIGG